MPYSPNSAAFGLAPKSAASSIRGLAAAQPERVGDLEQRRVAERAQPPLAARAADPGDLLIGVIEQALQLINGERPPGRVALGVLGVHGDVPLVAHLDRVRPEPLLALAPPTRTPGRSRTHRTPATDPP